MQGKHIMSLDTFLEHHLGEHFKSFMIIAYDHEGIGHVMEKYETQEEFDSLLTSLKRQKDKFDYIIQDQIFEQFGKEEAEEEDDE